MEKEKEKSVKEKAPKEFVPTELGSGVFASVNGRPNDKEYLVLKENDKDDHSDRSAQ